MKIPFWCLPASWGLKGTAREEAEANYYLDGEDLEKKLASIRLSGKEYQYELVNISKRYGHIDDYEEKRQIINIKYDNEDDLKVALLDLDAEFHKIEKNEYEKQRANILKEPWIGIIDNGFNPDEGLNGVYFEFDWNDYWIDFLKMNGYTGYTDDQLVEQWFSDVCKTQIVNNMSDEERLKMHLRL